MKQKEIYTSNKEISIMKPLDCKWLYNWKRVRKISEVSVLQL